MRILSKYVYYMNKFSENLGKTMSYAIFPLLGILLIEAFSRYALNNPTIWSIELATFVFGAYFITGGACVLMQRKHVRMNIFYSKWSPRKRAIVDAITFALLAVYVIMFIRGGIASSLYSIVHNHHTASMWGPHYGPIKVITTFGGCLLLLQGVAILIQDIYTAVKGKDLFEQT